MGDLGIGAREFDHTRLRVYQDALRLVKAVESVVPALGGRPDLVDQLRRAAASVVLNIAEGAGEYAPREKARFYRIAKRSTAEAAAVLDIAVHLGMTKAESVAPAQDAAKAAAAALTRLVRTLEYR